MCEFLGKRVIRKVKREGFIEEEEFDRILMEEYGVTEEELQEDIERSGMQGGYRRAQADIRLPDGETVTLYAEEEGEYQVFNYLEGLAPEAVFQIWVNMDNRRAIGSLIRYPGEQHEWLMVAALPFLKGMKIPLRWMKEFRTPTGQCLFHYTDKDGQDQTGVHGGPGSGLMHIDLLRCYTSVYKQVDSGECEPGHASGQAIANNLLRFVMQYYKEADEAPEALMKLINKLMQMKWIGGKV